MAWQSFLILKNNVKEHNEKTNRIYLPRDTAGAGLFFIMPKKYVRRVRGKRNIVSVGYSSDFIFHLYEEKDGRTLQTKENPLKANDVGRIFADMHREAFARIVGKY